MGGELLVRGAGVGGVIIVLIFDCIPAPFIRTVVDTFLERIRSLSAFSTCGDSKVKRVASFAAEICRWLALTGAGE